jgi:plastocyanin
VKTRFIRQPQNPLGQIVLTALLGCALGYTLLQLLIGVLVVPIVIIAVCFFAAAGVVATGWRWGPTFGAALKAAFCLAALTVARPYTLDHLLHPDQFGPFVAIARFFASAIIAVVAGVAATRELDRPASMGMPETMRLTVVAIGGTLLGAVLVAGIVSTLPAATTAGGGYGGGQPTIHLAATSFTQSAVIVSHGDTLRLVDDSGMLHIFQNGSWQQSGSHPMREAGAPAVTNVQIQGQGASVTFGPFATSGTFHIFCTIHPGMSLTVFVA